MAFESITDATITALLLQHKTVTNPRAHRLDKASHWQINYQVHGVDGDDFTLYVRQNLRILNDFSCGLSWHAAGGDVLTLVRYNGSSHQHRNRLPPQQLPFGCHIHRATQAYVHANRKPEGHADLTDRYHTVAGALYALVTDCNISGITTTPDEPDLF